MRGSQKEMWAGDHSYWALSNEELLPLATGQVREGLRARRLASHILARRGVRASFTRKGYGWKLVGLLLLGCVVLFAALVLVTWLWWLWAMLAISGLVAVFVVEIRAHMSGANGGIIPAWSPEHYESIRLTYRGLVEKPPELGRDEVLGLYCGDCPANDSIHSYELYEFQFFYYEMDGVSIVGRREVHAQNARRWIAGVSTRRLHVQGEKPDEYEIVEASTP
jgi:hypothetical protein